MSRSEKRSPQGDRHRSDKEFKKIAAKKARAKDRGSMATFDGEEIPRPLSCNKNDPYSVAWDGSKEDCRHYRSREETKKDVRDTIEDAKKELLGETWVRQSRKSQPDLHWDMSTSISEFIQSKRGPWKQCDPKPWAKVKRWMFWDWNEKVLKVLGIQDPIDLWKVTDDQVDAAAELLYKRRYLKK